MSIQDWFPLGWTGWIFLHSKGLSRVSSNTISKVSILRHSAFFIVQLSHPYMITGKTIVLTRWQSFDFDVGKVMSLLFNMLSWLVILAWRIPGMGEPGGLVYGVPQSRTWLMWLSSSICISEVIDISPSNLYSSLCFLQPSISHDVLCLDIK